MEILEIKIKSKTNPNIFICKTDNGEFEFFSDVLVKNKIKAGEIDEKNFYLFHEESSQIIAYNLSLKYVGNRFKTEKQISDYLIKKNYSKSTIEIVLEKLKNYSIINDKIYAENYIRSNTNFSKNKLKQKLRSVGVSSTDFDELDIKIDDSESCKKHCEKFLKNKLPTKQTKEKLIRRLMGMGYTWETINSIIRSFSFNDE